MYRPDLWTNLRLLLRPQGAVGVIGTVASLAALGAAYLPWYEVAAGVELLDVRQSRAVATLAGWQAQPWSWVVPALALVALVVSLAVAVDRPPRPAGDLQIGAGIGLALAAGASAMLFPATSRFDVAGSRLRELTLLAERLPDGVAVDFQVQAASGLWVTLGAAALLVAVGMASREV